MRHLTDEEIQSCLQSGRPEEWNLIEDHLNICPECQNQLLLYRRLGDIVASATCKPTPNGFEKAVLKRLTSIQRQRRLSDIIAAVLTLIVILAAGVVFLVTPSIRQITASFLAHVWQQTIQFTSGSGGSTESLAIPLFGFLLMMLFAGIDRWIMAKLKTAKEA